MRRSFMLVKVETPDFIPCEQSGLSPVDYTVWSVMHERVYQGHSKTLANCASALYQFEQRVRPLIVNHHGVC